MTGPLHRRAGAPRRRLLVALPATALALSGLLAGCGGDDEPSTSPDETPPASAASETPSETGSADTSPEPEPAGTEVDVTVKGDSISPTNKQLEIGVGDTVTLHMTSDRGGELHVHSSPEQELEFGAGQSDVQITLDKPGSVDVEEHESETLILRILVS